MLDASVSTTLQTGHGDDKHTFCNLMAPPALRCIYCTGLNAQFQQFVDHSSAGHQTAAYTHADLLHTSTMKHRQEPSTYCMSSDIQAARLDTAPILASCTCDAPLETGPAAGWMCLRARHSPPLRSGQHRGGSPGCRTGGRMAGHQQLRPCSRGISCGHGPSRTCGPCCARTAWCGSGGYRARHGA